MKPTYITFREAAELLGGSVEGLAQSFELGFSPFHIYVRLERAVATYLGCLEWEENERGWPILDSYLYAFTSESYKDTPATRIWLEKEGFKPDRTVLDGYFRAHRLAARAAVSQESQQAEPLEVLVLPPDTAELLDPDWQEKTGAWIKVSLTSPAKRSSAQFFLERKQVESFIAQRSSPAGSLADSNKQEETEEDGKISPQQQRRINSLLRMIAALEKMAGLPERGYSSAVELKFEQLGLARMSRQSIEGIIKEARRFLG